MKVTFIENGVEVEFEGQPMKKITLIDKEGWTEYDYAVAVITCVNTEPDIRTRTQKVIAGMGRFWFLFWPMIVIAIGSTLMTNDIRNCLECNIFDAFDNMDVWGIVGLLMTMLGFGIYGNRLMNR